MRTEHRTPPSYGPPHCTLPVHSSRNDHNHTKIIVNCEQCPSCVLYPKGLAYTASRWTIEGDVFFSMEHKKICHSRCQYRRPQVLRIEYQIQRHVVYNDHLIRARLFAMIYMCSAHVDGRVVPRPENVAFLMPMLSYRLLIIINI